MMRRNLTAVLCATTILLAAPLGWAQGNPPQQKKEPTAFDQTRTMGGVLEDVLHDQGLVGSTQAFVTSSNMTGGPLVGSPFDVMRPAVAAEYIPTIGAILRVEVGFPLAEPKDAVKAGQGSEPTISAQDLWEKNSTTTPAPYKVLSRAGEAGGSAAGAPAGENWNLFMVGNGGGRAFPVPGLPDQDYDPKRIETLRQTVLGALGQYGNRMTGLAPDEKIVVIVSHTVPTTIRFGTPTEVLAGMGDDAGDQAEHLLLSVTKSDVRESTNADALAARATEQLYRTGGSDPAPTPLVVPLGGPAQGLPPGQNP